jgi:hypothetical protein
LLEPGAIRLALFQNLMVCDLVFWQYLGGISNRSGKFSKCLQVAGDIGIPSRMVGLVSFRVDLYCQRVPPCVS